MINNSSKTSLNQVPALHKKISWKFGMMNLDLGGGKFDTATDYLNSLGVNNFVFDPYNRSKEHNARVLLLKDYDSATIANVLNVIECKDERVRALKAAKKYVKQGGTIFISVYEGNKSGEGSISSIGTFQGNKKLREYLRDIYDVWPPECIKIKKNMIEVKNGNDPPVRHMCPSVMQLPESGNV